MKHHKKAYATEISARLRAARARADLTLSEASTASGVHHVSISRYEHGRLPTVDSLYALASAYRIEVADLIPPIASLAAKGKR